jgi:hypothetical protein
VPLDTRKTQADHEGVDGPAIRKHFDEWASVLLVLLALCGLESVYRLSSFLWMATAEPAYKHVWLDRIYLWIAISLSLGISWIALLIALVAHGRRLK